MIVKQAQNKDLGSIYDLGFESYSQEALGSYNTIIDKDRVKLVVEQLVNNGTVFLAESEGYIIGVLIGSIVPCAFSKDLIYSTMFFYMRPEYRYLSRSFLKQLEGILKVYHITKFILGNPQLNNGDKMERFYQIAGFKKLESHFVKNI